MKENIVLLVNSANRCALGKGKVFLFCFVFVFLPPQRTNQISGSVGILFFGYFRICFFIRLNWKEEKKKKKDSCITTTGCFTFTSTTDHMLSLHADPLFISKRKHGADLNLVWNFGAFSLLYCVTPPSALRGCNN